MPRSLPRFLALLVLVGLTMPGVVFGDVVQFGSPPVHPLDMTPDGTRLLAAHTPDHRLVVFDLTQGGNPVMIAEIQVGIEPVTVRARSNTEAWVVNHISDSISIIDLTTMNVVRTLLVGDEPTDVVFAGSPEKAFVVISQLDMVKVYDTTDLDAAPVELPLEASDPRSLAVSPDGTKVYLAILESGNHTTIVPEAVVDTSALGHPPIDPPKNPALPNPPKRGLIVRHDGTTWRDEIGRDWGAYVPYQLYDNDVYEIDVATLGINQVFHDVGTSLFTVEVNPVTGRLYVSNQESFNEIIHEPKLNGHFAQSRVTTIDPGPGTVTPVHVNSHINYGDPAGNPTERSLSLGLLTDIEVNAAGDTVYVASFGSNQVGVLDADGNILKRITAGQGPSGLALDQPRNRLYVLNRHLSDISVVNLADDSSTLVPLGFDPTPIMAVFGRMLFYSTQNSSSHGDLACASCHIFGVSDGLAWDLGDPTVGAMIPAPQPQAGPLHPIKGPLVTQQLRGLDGTQPLHWRGDRNDVEIFNIAFTNLQGRPDSLSAFDMDLIKQFLFTVNYPPNPFRNLDGSLANPGSGPNPTTGENLFFNGGLVGGSNCDFCHHMPTGTSGVIFPAGSILENQSFKSPQFRALYEKTRFTPDQPFSVRGFGFTHNGEDPEIFDFLFSGIFTFANDTQKRDVEAFLLSFNGDAHAAVGAQLTMDGTNEATWLSRLNTLLALADGNQVGLIAKGYMNGLYRGWVYLGAGTWQSDRSWAPTQTTQDLLDLAGPGTEVTFTAVVEGCETSLGVDRDADGWYDLDEIDAGTNPGDPNSFPTILATGGGVDARRPVVFERAFPNPVAAPGTRLAFTLAEDGPVSLKVFDVQGRLVRNMIDEPSYPRGRHVFQWDLQDDFGRGVQGGIFFVRLATAEGVEGQRLVVIR